MARSTVYNDCRARWEGRAEERKKARPRGGTGGDWLVDKPELEMDAVPFLATLRRLGRLTGDRRYLDLHRDLMVGDLIDRESGKWARWGTTLAQSDTRFMCELIDEDIAGGAFTEREAIAAAVDELDIDANSFDAACTRVRDLLHAHRATLVREKPG
jgi:hypothetical protein